MERLQQFQLRQFNNILTLLVIAVCLYIIVYPFLPALILPVRKQLSGNGYVYQSQLGGSPGSAKPIPPDNRLVIPALLIDEPIREGRNIRVIDYNGTWHRPNSVTPDQPGNSVIIGHRFTYKGSSTFYNLDKLKDQDIIIVYWHGKEYDYRVTSSRVVAPTETAVEAPTSNTQLTLYTCTPLSTAKNRLVVTALPVAEDSQP